MALLVHGLGAHSAWFEAAARELVKQGFFVIAYDQCGFGSRRNVPFKSYKQWINDLSTVVAFTRATYEGLPLLLMGNSMGALVVMAASRQVDVDGLVIFSPGFDGHPDAFSLGYKLKSILSAVVLPQREIELPYGFEIVSRAESVRTWLESDPQKRAAVPGSMLVQLLLLSQNVLANLKQVNAPLLMITAGKERVVNNEVNLRLFNRLVAPQKKHICMQESWHDLMFDPVVDEVAAEIAGWQTALAQTPKSSWLATADQ